MQNSKIVQLLRCLSKEELREFRRFVRSPFHNKRKDVVLFYDALKKSSKDFQKDSITKEEIFKKLYPRKKYDPNVIVLLSSYLFNLCQEYLTISDLKQDDFFYKYHFLKSLDKHYADDLFEKKYKNTRKNLSNEKLSENYFFQSSLLEELDINFNLRRNRQFKVSSNIVHFGDLSLYSFIVKFVVMYHDMVANKSAFNHEFKDSAIMLFINNFNFEGFMKQLKLDDSRQHNYIVYYYYLFMCIYHPGREDYFLKLKEYSFKDFETIDEEEKSVRFLYLIHYCIYQIEAGNMKYLQESFKVYTEALEKKLYQFDRKDIGLMFFRNFVMVGLAAKEYDYIENFISEFSKELKEDYKDELIKLCRAMLHFEKNLHNEALNYLNSMDNSYPAFRLGVKHLYLKIYYEINDYDSFFSLIDSYKHYLKNDKSIPQRIAKLHINFLNYSGRLAKIKSSGDRDELFILEKEIKENPELDFRHKLWLLDKVEDI